MGIKVSDGTSGGGEWFRPANGMYVMEFTGFTDSEQKGFETDEMEPAWDLSFRIGSFPAFDLLKDDAGEPRVYVERVKRSLHPRSNAYGILKALLDREIETGEDSDDLFAEAAGKKMLAQFDKSTTGKDGRLKGRMPFKQVG